METPPIILKSGEGLPASFGGKIIILKTVGAETHNMFSLMEYILPARGKGSGFHIHKTFEKSIYILEGSLIIRIEDQIIEATPGMFVMIPRGSAHDFMNPNDYRVQFLMQFTPAGFEQLFIEMSKVDTSKPDAAKKIAEIRSRHDVIDVPIDWISEL